MMVEGEETMELIRKIGNLQLKGKRKYQPYYQKSSLPTWGQVKAMCTNKEVTYETHRSLCQPENLLLVMLSALTCASAVGYPWARVLVFCSSSSFASTWILDGSSFTNDSVFMPGPWDCNIHSSEKGIAFNSSLGFESLPICIGHHDICIPTKGQIWTFIL